MAVPEPRAAARPGRRQGAGRAARRAAVQAAGPELRGGAGDGTGGSPRWRRCGPGDVVLEVGPGLGSLTLALLEAGPARVVAVEIDRVLAGELPPDAARAPGAGRPGDGDQRRRAGRRRALTCRRRALDAGRQPALQRGRAGGAAPAGRRSRRWPAGWSWCRPRWRTGCARPRVAGVRRAVGQAGLVRRGPVGRDGAAQRVLAGAQRRLAAGRVHPARPARRDRVPRGGVRAGRRRVRAAAQDAARRAGRLGGVGAGGRAPAPRGRDRSRRARGIARRGRVRPAGRGGRPAAAPRTI